MIRRFSASVAVLAAMVIGHPAGAQGPLAVTPAFRAAYNLDYGEAIEIARRDVAAQPESAAAHRALATIVWLEMLFRRGAVTVDHYMGGLTKSPIKLPPPPASEAEEFKRHVNRSIALAEAQVQRQPRDVSARYDLGAAWGLQASYLGSIEGKVRPAFSAAKRAFDAHERVLDADRARVDAGLVVGTYRYVIAALSLPARLIAYIAGFGGGRERGIAQVEMSTKGLETHIDARFALVIIYSREGRHPEALKVVRGLAAEFPRNRLLTLEEGASAVRAGRAGEAEATLTAALAWHDTDPRPKFPGERALLIYKRGMARVSLNHLPDASTDFRAALAEKPPGWVRGRIHLEQGKVADLTGRRSEALSEYRLASTLCAASLDPLCEADAANLIKQPFKFR